MFLARKRYAAGLFLGVCVGVALCHAQDLAPRAYVIETKLYRSGLLDSFFRFAVNIKGGPAMSLREFQSWQQKLFLGVSLKVVAPTGQYDPTKLVNNGSNRWAFKPEFGYSERWGHWVVDRYASVCLTAISGSAVALP